jgi:hypothetical protein
MPYYTSRPSRPLCPECRDWPTQHRRGCEGTNLLRHFDSWNDLASHLDEATIVHLVNAYATISPEYDKLKEAEDLRRQKAHDRNETNKRLLEFAKANLDKIQGPQADTTA